MAILNLHNSSFKLEFKHLFSHTILIDLYHFENYVSILKVPFEIMLWYTVWKLCFDIVFWKQVSELRNTVLRLCFE